MKLELPRLQRTPRVRQLIANERKTAYLIQTLWNAAGGARRKEPAFLLLLVHLAWTNVRNETGRESTRRWRNRKIAEYLETKDVSDIPLARALAKAFPSVNMRIASRLIKMHTGISNYYGAFRSPTDTFVLKNARVLKGVFSQAAAMHTPPLKKVKSLVSTVSELGPIRGPRAPMSPLNGLTPALACLDPDGCFPIINKRTQPLLRRLTTADQSVEGPVELVKLIGKRGIRNSFDLDVYTLTTTL